MNSDFWLDKWRRGETGFHRDAPMPLLVDHWDAIGARAGCRVLVPLCGKSLDMLWLASRGHRVLGVELSPLAIEQFLADNQIEADAHDSPQGRRHVAGAIEIINGDVLELDDATLAGCDAIYDRAAIIALPAPMRQRYAERVYARLPTDARGLMITLDYPQAEMDGPPFSVDETEVDALFGSRFTIDRIDRRDILASQPSFRERGVSALHTSVFGMRRHA